VTTTYVVGVDPGQSTGIFVLRDGARFAAYQGTATGALSALDALLAALRADPTRPTVVIAVERFVTTGETARHTRQGAAQEVLGVVHRLAESFDCDVVLQTPADAKRIAPNALLRELGLLVTRDEVGQPDADDVNDAARHAVLCLARRFASIFDRLLQARP
jgi:hypothetical protein